MESYLELAGLESRFHCKERLLCSLRSMQSSFLQQSFHGFCISHLTERSFVLCFFSFSLKIMKRPHYQPVHFFPLMINLSNAFATSIFCLFAFPQPQKSVSCPPGHTRSPALAGCNYPVRRGAGEAGKCQGLLEGRVKNSSHPTTLKAVGFYSELKPKSVATEHTTVT